MALKNNIILEGLTGNNDGVIGALAAIGLRYSGNDGRFVSVKGKELREINGIFTKTEILGQINIDDIITENFDSISDHEYILTGD